MKKRDLSDTIYECIKKRNYKQALIMLKENHNKLDSSKYNALSTLCYRCMLFHAADGFVPTSDILCLISLMPINGL